jgi:hypothetical protein
VQSAAYQPKMAKIPEGAQRILLAIFGNFGHLRGYQPCSGRLRGESPEFIPYLRRPDRVDSVDIDCFGWGVLIGDRVPSLVDPV